MSPAEASPSELAARALELLHAARSGVLATLSAQHDGHPHASLAPYAVRRDGALLLVLSELAEHTRNVRADPRASVFVQDPGSHANLQATPRLCAMGRVAELEGEAREEARARYTARHPEGEFYLAKLDFRVYALAVERLHLIGGFGRVTWLEAEALRGALEPDPLADAAAGVCAHMNDDHADVLVLYLEAFRGRPGARARMTGLDAWGFDVVDESRGERFRFDFPVRTTSPEHVRKHVVAMAREARARLGKTA